MAGGRWTPLAQDGDLRVAHLRHSSGQTYRDAELARDGTDVMALIIATGGPVRLYQRDIEIKLATGEAAYLETCTPGTVGYHLGADYSSVLVPRSIVRKAIKSEGHLMGQRWQSSNSALNLMAAYVACLKASPIGTSTELNRAATRHISELFVLGAREAVGISPSSHGDTTNAIRAKLALSFMAEHFCDPNLRISDIASAQRISPRYLHQQLEQEGLQFKTFITEKRLEKAYRDLTDPDQDARTVSDIALACGFSDVSHFNRVFRARYDVTPSAVRAKSRRET